MRRINSFHYQNIVRYLARLYGGVFAEFAGTQHPLMVFRPDVGQIDAVDSVLGNQPQPSRGDETFFYYNLAYLQTIQNSSRNVYDGPTFAFKNLRVSPLKFTAKQGRYFDMLATCIALEDELRATMTGSFIRLVGRSQYHRFVSPERSLVDGYGRSAAIGVATLMVINYEGSYRAILAQRSAQSATDPLFFHVLPAFIFQPSRSDSWHSQEWSVSHQIYREFLEELFAFPEAAAPERYDYFYDHPALIELRQMINRGMASLHLTGVVINLLTLRPEICALLLIHDPQWYARASTGWDAISLNTDAEVNQRNIILAPIESDSALLDALPPHVHTIMPPQATAALWLGVELARRKLGNSP